MTYRKFKKWHWNGILYMVLSLSFLLTGCKQSATVPNDSTASESRTETVTDRSPVSSDQPTQKPDQPEEPVYVDMKDDGSTVPLETPDASVRAVSVYSGTPDTSWFTEGSQDFILTTADQQTALFGAAGGYAVIKNLSLINSYINGNSKKEVKGAAVFESWVVRGDAYPLPAEIAQSSANDETEAGVPGHTDQQGEA